MKIGVLDLKPGDQDEIVRVLERIVATTNAAAQESLKAEAAARLAKEREAKREAALVQTEVARREAMAADLTASFRMRRLPGVAVLEDLRASGDPGSASKTIEDFLEPFGESGFVFRSELERQAYEDAVKDGSGDPELQVNSDNVWRERASDVSSRRSLHDSHVSSRERRDTAAAASKRRSVHSRSSRLTKQEFVSEVARRAGLSNRDAKKAVDAFLHAVTDALHAGDDVAFRGFGKFSVAHRAARMRINPRNPNEKVQIAAWKAPKFSAGSILKAAVTDKSRS